jgi:hypothetical protein
LYCENPKILKPKAMNLLTIGLLIAALISLILMILLIAEREHFSETDLPKEREKNTNPENSSSDEYGDLSGGLMGI